MMPCRQTSDLAYKARLDAEIDRAEADDAWRNTLAQQIAERWLIRDPGALSVTVLADAPRPYVLAEFLADHANSGTLPPSLREGLIESAAESARATIDQLLDTRMTPAQQAKELAFLPDDLITELRQRLDGNEP